MGRTSKAERLGELIVAVLEVFGPTEARHLVAPIAEVESMRRFSVHSLGVIASKTDGVILLREKPRAIFHLEEGRTSDLPTKIRRRIDSVLQDYSPPTGGAEKRRN